MAKKTKGEKTHPDGERRKLAKDLRVSLKLRGDLDRTFVVLERVIDARLAREAKKKAGAEAAEDLELALRAHKAAVRALAYGEGGGGV